MKILGIEFFKKADNKLHSEIMQDYACMVQYCIEKKRGNFALVRETREFAHDVWKHFFMVVDVRYDIEYNARDRREASAKFAEFVKYGAPYDKQAVCEATIAELVAFHN